MRILLQLETYSFEEDALVNPLLDDDHNKLWSVIWSKASEAFRQLRNFKLFHHPQLAIANSITEHKYVPWQPVIDLAKQAIQPRVQNQFTSPRNLKEINCNPKITLNYIQGSHHLHFNSWLRPCISGPLDFLPLLILFWKRKFWDNW